MAYWPTNRLTRFYRKRWALLVVPTADSGAKLVARYVLTSFRLTSTACLVTLASQPGLRIASAVLFEQLSENSCLFERYHAFS
jgi:hypothetical protein